MQSKIKYDKKFILDSIKLLGQRHGLSEAFRDVVVCGAYSFANAIDFKEEREKEYLKTINSYLPEEIELFPLIITALVFEYEKASSPVDILGDIYEELGLIKKGREQFFTPLPVCETMAKITADKGKAEEFIKEKGYMCVSDPTCGSGRNLYAVYKELLDNGIDSNRLLIMGDDIDLTCCCMTYLQLSLMGASTIINHQDTIYLEKYDVFYTIGYALNKELQELSYQNETKKGSEDEIEV